MQLKSESLDDIFIIGGGVAGVSAALELADKGHPVTVVEQNTIGSGASGRNPGRMGHGFHYVHIETAKMYLTESIRVQKKYPNFLVGQDLPFNAPLRHGRYFIMKDSDHPKDKILATYQAIKEEYQRLILEDPTNEVFGPPESFFRVLEPFEYQDTVNTDLVDIGVETAEHLFNWNNFLAYIKEKLFSHPNITVYEHIRVESLQRGEPNESRFIIKANHANGNECLFHCDFIINSTWENIEYLNSQVGISMVPSSRTNRLKTLLIVRLPESLRNANSMFFCMGQYCMMSNLNGDKAMCTYAKVTNMETSSGLKMSNNARRLLDGGATPEEKNKIAQQMLDGIKNYIPDMAHAVPEDVFFGIVQTEGKLTLEDLTNHNSSFHERNYYGIREEQIGLISNPCVKLFYFAGNGELIVDLIKKQIKSSKTIKACMKEMEKKLKEDNINFSLEMKRFLLSNLERSDHVYLSKRSIDEITADLMNSLKQKKELNSSIAGGFFNTKLNKTEQQPMTSYVQESILNLKK